ncbi:MAG: glycosyltransferase involved in cell wall biosynthesis [Myxococcota bacterium]
MTLRVAMVGLRAPWGTEGGVEAAVGALAPRLAALGCEVTIYCRRRYNTLGSGMHNGVRLVDVDTIYTRHLEAIVHTALAAPRAAAGADIVHIHATGPSLLSWVPRLAGRATVVTLHGLDWQREKWGLAARLVLRAGARSAATFPHRLIAVGAHLRDHYEEHYGVRPDLIPNGVSPIPTQPLERSGVAGLQRRRYLLFVGRLVPEKGLERLMAAYAASGSGMPLVIAGGATHMEDYRRRLESLAPPGVLLVGPRYGEARDALLSHARAFVLPSTLEGFPLAALEAMASGLPVLLSDIPPHQELLSGCRPSAGWLVADDEWADALGAVTSGGWARLAAMGAIGQTHVAEQYSWDRIAEQTLATYHAALAQQGQKSGC